MQVSNNEQYKVNISEVLKRANTLSKSNNWFLVQGLFCILGISLVVYWAFFYFYEIDIANLETFEPVMTRTQQVIMDLTLIVLLSPLWTGVSMLAIFYARGSKPPSSIVFSYFSILPMVAIGSAIISIFISFGLMLFIIPSFYVFAATTFTLPLIADKNYTPFHAIVTSIKTVNKHLAGILGLYGIFAVSMLLVLITFGLAYMWIGPLYFNAKAVLYQDLFCAEQAVECNDSENGNGKKDTTIFDA